MSPYPSQITIFKEEKKKDLTQKLLSVLKDLKDQLDVAQNIPELRIKARSKKNMIEHDLGFFTLGQKKTIKKSLKTKGGAKELLKLVKTIVFILSQMKDDKTSTVRDFFYNSLNWISDAQFEDVQEANYCIENIEILVDDLRENFNIVAEADGCVYGPVVLQTQNRKGIPLVVDCQEGVGDSGFLLPRRFEDLKINSVNCKFGLIIETGGFFSRLIEDGFYQKHKCLLIHTKGQPSRCLRRFIKELNQTHNIPFYAFSDADTWGGIIVNTIKRGSVKSSHLASKLCTPAITHIGLLPSQIERFNLPWDNITKDERRVAELLLKDDRATPELKEEMRIMLRTGRKAEQQGLSYWGLSYVSDVYLQLVLKEFGAPIVTTVTEADIKKNP